MTDLLTQTAQGRAATHALRSSKPPAAFFFSLSLVIMPLQKFRAKPRKPPRGSSRNSQQVGHDEGKRKKERIYPMQAHSSPKAVEILHCTYCSKEIEQSRFPWSSGLCQACSDQEEQAHFTNHSTGCSCSDCSPK